MQTSITRKWVIKGSEPKVMSKPGKDKASYSGFLIQEPGVLYMDEPLKFNYETVINSIRSFIKAVPPKDKKYLIIMDNASWHKKAIRLIEDLTNEEYADIREAARFMSLPPYSPDLNPIEQVWRVTRRQKTHNRYFPSLPALKETLASLFKEWAKPNELLKSLANFSCFRPTLDTVSAVG